MALHCANLAIPRIPDHRGFLAPWGAPRLSWNRDHDYREVRGRGPYREEGAQGGGPPAKVVGPPIKQWGPPAPAPAYSAGGSWRAAAKSALTKFFRRVFPKVDFLRAPVAWKGGHISCRTHIFWTGRGSQKFPENFFEDSGTLVYLNPESFAL